MYFHAWSSRRAGGRGIPAGDPPPFTAPAWFPPAEISSAGATLKTCPGKFSSRCASQKKRCCEERAAHPGRPFFNAFFSFGPAAARFLFLQKEKMGGGSLRQSRASGGRSLLKPSPSSGGNAAEYAGTTPTSPLPSSGPLRRPPSPIGGRLSRDPSLTPAFGGSAAAPRRRCPPPIPAGWRREWRKWWCCGALPDPRPSPAAPGNAAPATVPRSGPWGRPY